MAIEAGLVGQQQPAMGAPEVSPNAAVMMLLNRYRLTQVIHVAARFGIADVLAAGPTRVEELASACDAHPGALYRLLRAAAAFGVFRQDEEGRFENTALSERLRADVVLSLRPLALMMGEDRYWGMWGDFLDTVKTGAPVVPHPFECDKRGYPARDAARSAIVRAVVEATLVLDALAVLSLYDFGHCQTLLYPGFHGGYVGFLVRFFRRYPQTHAIVLELPENELAARSDLARAGVLDRCRVIAAEPLSPLPLGADTHILRSLITYYDNETAVRFLRQSRGALQDGGRLLIVAMLVPPRNEFGVGTDTDLEAMLVSAGAGERTEEQYLELLAGSGFRVRQILRGRAPTAVIEAVAV